MKHVPSHITALRRLIDEELRVELIAETLYVVEGSDPAAVVASHLERLGYDECGVRCGVRCGGVVSASVRLADLVGETSGDAAKLVPLERVVAPATPLWSCLDRIARDGPLFVLGDHGLDGIVTRADLNKQPARLLMFGVISTLEMVLLALIRRHHEADGWRGSLTDDRVGKAETLHSERRRRREEIDLVDCLQLGDKVTVCLKTPEIRDAWGLSKSQAESLFKDLQRIRDNLAHAQSPAPGGDWPETVAALKQGHELLDRSVEMLGEPLREGTNG